MSQDESKNDNEVSNTVRALLKHACYAAFWLKDERLV